MKHRDKSQPLPCDHGSLWPCYVWMVFITVALAIFFKCLPAIDEKYSLPVEKRRTVKP